VSVFLTPKIVVSVSVSEGQPAPTPTPKPFFFCYFLKEKNANKVGFKIKKYLQHLKTALSVSVPDFPTPKDVGVMCRIRH
jgi:hypothetical protein